MTATAQDIRDAARRLREGGLVAFPTETVYGLGADALNEHAVAAVFRLKGRPANNPLIVHVADVAAARALTPRWDARAEAIARAFWPGPVSIIVPRGERVPDLVTAGGPGVALRCPRHPVALALLREVGLPLVGPSANPSGRVSPTTAQHVREAFEGLMVLDGGPCEGGIESTVVSLMGPTPVVLRPGLVSAEALGLVLDEPVGIGPGEATAHGAMASPGLLASHYAPRAPVVLVDAAGVASALARAPGGRAAALVLGESAITGPGVTRILMPAGAGAYAARLYAALREADALDPSLIVVEEPGGGSSDPLWVAIRDRLARAAAARP